MLRSIRRRLDPWTLAIIAAAWAGLSAWSFLASPGEMTHRSLYAWVVAQGLNAHSVGWLMVVDTALLLVTLWTRASAALRSMICLTSSMLWVEFGARTLTAGLTAGAFVPRSSLADLACGLCLALATIEWPFFRSRDIFRDFYDE